MIVVEIVAGILLIGGALFLLASALGVLRFPDFYTRLHAGGKGDTLGQTMVLLGLLVHAVAKGYAWTVPFKLGLIMFLIFIINPTATHALARGAWVAGIKPYLPGSPTMEPGDEREEQGDVAEDAEEAAS